MIALYYVGGGPGVHSCFWHHFFVRIRVSDATQSYHKYLGLV